MFVKFLIAQGCSLTGGYVQTLALSWVAADFGGGLLSLACYMIACYLPVAALSYPFGRWLDRRPQKGWLLLSEGVLAGLSVFLWWASVKEWLTFPFLLIFGGVWGVVRAFQTPIYQSLPRRLSSDLSKGTALLTVITHSARGLGPVIGGLLYAKWGASAAFLANALSFAPSLLFLSLLKLPAPQKSAKTNLRQWIKPLLEIFLTCFLGVNYNVTFVALVKQAELGTASYGIAMGLLGLGALLGFWLKGKVKKSPAPGVFLPWMGGLNLALSFFSSIWAQGVCIFLYGILDFWYFATASYGLSKKAKEEEITAVMGLYTVVTIGALPAGALFWSAIAKAWGLRIALILIGMGLLIYGWLPSKNNSRT